MASTVFKELRLQFLPSAASFTVPCVPCESSPEMSRSRRTTAAVAAEEIGNLFPAVFEAGVDQFKAGWAERRISHHRHSEADINTFVGPSRPVIDKDWTAEDEAWLMKTWEDSSTKKTLERIGSHSQELLKLWRLSCTLMRCSPVSIVSPQYGLVYDGLEPTRTFFPKDHAECSPWSDGFCKALHTLVVHSFWRGDARLLATTIQFTVICRTDNRQPWKMAMGPSSCLAVEKMRDVAMSRRTRHFHDVLRDYTTSQAADGRESSLEYEFLSYLGSIIEKPSFKPVEEQSEAHPPVYAVRTADLNTILRALDTFNPNGYPLFTHSDVFLRASTSAQLRSVFPNEGKLRELHTRSFLHESRLAYREMRAKKRAPRTPRTFQPCVAWSGGEPATTRLRREGELGSAAEVVAIIDDEEESRPGMASSLRGGYQRGKNHNYRGGGHRQQQQQSQSQQHPHKRKKYQNGHWNRQRTSEAESPTKPFRHSDATRSGSQRDSLAGWPFVVGNSPNIKHFVK